MAFLEGIRVQNYRALRDVTLGRVHGSGAAEPLTPLTAVIGKNGVGKSTLFDAFAFVLDCVNTDVETACNMRNRGGFDQLISRGIKGEITIEILYRDEGEKRAIWYQLKIEQDLNGRPFASSELLEDEESEDEEGKYFLVLKNGRGHAWKADSEISVEVETTDSRRLGVSTLGHLKDFQRPARFCDFIKNWHLSYFHPDAAREKPMSGPQRHLNERGDNIGNVVQYMEREHKERFQTVLDKVALKIPGIRSIKAQETDDKRLLLRFNDGAFTDPFFADQMSDGTLKLLAYLLLLEDPAPPSFLCIEEPENGLYHKLLDTLAQELRAHATGKPGAPQVFVTTHQPYFVDALSPKEVWILEKGEGGFAKIQRASDIELVRNLFDEGMPLGGLWYSDYLDAR